MPSDTCNQNTWVTNGQVYAIAPAGDKVYIGGEFTQIGPYTGGGVPINSSTGAPVAAFPKINGTVYATCTDGNGGWFVGGSFTAVGAVARNNIAHILSSGSVDPAWNPSANGIVYSLVKSGTTVYAGGIFDSIGGQSRNNIAALDATTGKALPWNPNASSTVLSLAVSGTMVYVGGNFTSIGQGNGHPYFTRFDSVSSTPVIQSISSVFGSHNAGLQIIGSGFRSGAFVKFAYSLSKSTHVSVRLYSINGQLQSELVNKHQDAGNYALSMQRGNCAPGAYLVAFSAGDYHQEKMITLMK